MKGKVLTILVLLTGTMILLSIPAMGKTRAIGPGNDPGSGPGKESGSKGGSLEKGFAYRYGSSSPSASIEYEEDHSGIEISLESISHVFDGNHSEIDLNETEWIISENDIESGKKVTYSGDCNWKGSNHVSSITLEFNYRWRESNRSIDIGLNIDTPPGEGHLSMEMKIGSRGLDDGCCFDTKQQKEHSFHYNNKEGRSLGELIIDEEADITTSGENSTVSTEIEMGSTDETQSLLISSYIADNTRSYSVSGSFRIFEDLVQILEEAGEGAVSYVREHLVSFFLGAVFVIIVFIIATIFVTRKTTQTGGKDLKLEYNRFYRKN